MKNKCVFFYKRLHNDITVLRFKKCLSEVKWGEILQNVNAEDDYNKFIKKFQNLYDECIPLKKNVRTNLKRTLSLLGSQKGSFVV